MKTVHTFFIPSFPVRGRRPGLRFPFPSLPPFTLPTSLSPNLAPSKPQCRVKLMADLLPGPHAAFQLTNSFFTLPNLASKYLFITFKERHTQTCTVQRKTYIHTDRYTGTVHQGRQAGRHIQTHDQGQKAIERDYEGGADE